MTGAKFDLDPHQAAPAGDAGGDAIANEIGHAQIRGGDESAEPITLAAATRAIGGDIASATPVINS